MIDKDWQRKQDEGKGFGFILYRGVARRMEKEGFADTEVLDVH